jgi:hypothetical protein
MSGFRHYRDVSDQQSTVHVNFQEAPMEIKACPVENFTDGRSTQLPLQNTANEMGHPPRLPGLPVLDAEFWRNQRTRTGRLSTLPEYEEFIL